MLRKILTLTIMMLCLTLTGCAIFRVHKIDIQQGNVITPQMVDQLKPGMSRQQVEQQLGTPVLIAPFREDQLYYVYTNKPPYQKTERRKLTIYFRNNRLTHYTTDVLPQPNFAQ